MPELKPEDCTIAQAIQEAIHRFQHILTGKQDPKRPLTDKNVLREEIEKADAFVQHALTRLKTNIDSVDASAKTEGVVS